MTTSPETENIVLVGMGNPLLDISAEVSPSLLEKYALEANNAILCEDKHKPLYAELVASYPVEYIAGGAAQNSIRGAQYMLPKNSTAYFGCIGKDSYADVMKNAAVQDGVLPKYQVDEEVATGTCAVLITGKHRSLVANLSAANNFKPSHLEKKENWAIIEKAKFFYISGFFYTVSLDSILLVAKHAAEFNKVLCMNLSAPFLCQFFKTQMLAALPYTDVLFGNESEALAFAQANELGTEDVKEIALKICAMQKVNAARKRVVVFTQGKDETVVAYDGKISTYAVIPIKEEDIVDTNGAGDAFVGGFLSKLVGGEDLESCVKAGHYLANIVIQRSGPTYPSTPCTYKA